MTIYCDESGGIGRGVMTLAAITISPDNAEKLLEDFCVKTGLTRELKGSRIDMNERALFYDLFAASGGKAMIGVAISALKADVGKDRGDHDRQTYTALLHDVIDAVLGDDGDCATIIIDDGRYDALSLDHIRRDIAAHIGPCGQARLELSHRLAGLQIADVVANTFFNRALVSDRQPQFAALVQPFLDDQRIKMRILASNLT